MNILPTPSFLAEYVRLRQSNPSLRKQVDAKLLILADNFRHPSLRLHKIKIRSSDFDPLFSISVNKSIRVLIAFRSDNIYLYHIGKHEDVY